MPSNREIYDATIRHQMDVRRYAASEVRGMLGVMEDADKELIRLLRKRLPRLHGDVDWTSARWRALLADSRDLRREAARDLVRRSRDALVDFGTLEAGVERRIIQGALPVHLQTAAVPASQIRALVTQQPFSGGAHAARTLGQWWSGVAAADQGRIRDALQLGVSLGESTDQIVRRLAGTRAEQYRDGVLADSRRNVETVTRTAVNHVSNAAREELWQANDDIMLGVLWTSTLDGRTSAVCAARDGHAAAFPGRHLPDEVPRLEPPTARPPAHPNCRSVVVALLAGIGLAQQLPARPFVRDDRTRQRREVDFRAQAKAKAGGRWRAMDEAQRRRAVKRLRDEWGERVVGSVPGKTNFDGWLRQQPAAFQDDYLGKTKGALFRRGKLKMDQFVDRRGQELNLAQLSQRYPEAFERANL
jgi:hypothetical protein